MELNPPGADYSNERPSVQTKQALAHEATRLKVSLLGMIKFELDGDTAPYSPKGLAECFFLRVPLSVLALTGGLGGICHWLGGPVWGWLTAGALGFVISVALTATFWACIKCLDQGKDPYRVAQEIPQIATQANALDIPLGALLPIIRELLERTSPSAVPPMIDGEAAPCTPDAQI